MKVLLIVLLVLLFLNLLPIGARVIFNETGFSLKLVFGLLQFRLLPGKDRSPEEVQAEEEEKQRKKQEKEKKKEQRQQKKKAKAGPAEVIPQEPAPAGTAPAEPAPAAPKKQPLGEKIESLLPWVRLACSALSDLPRLPTVRKLNLTVSLGGDAGKAALSYGKACGAIGAALALLRRKLKIRSYRIHPELAEGTDGIRVSADAVVTLTLGGLLCFLLKYGFRALKLFLSKKIRKAVK